MVLFFFSDLGLGTVVNIVFRAGDPDLLSDFLFFDVFGHFPTGIIGD